MAEGQSASVCGQHRVLEGIGGVVGVATGDLRQPVQLAVMSVEELLEGIAVTGDVRYQQLGVRPRRTGDPPESPHELTLMNRGPPS